MEERCSANEKLYVCANDVVACIRERGVCVRVCHISYVVMYYGRDGVQTRSCTCVQKMISIAFVGGVCVYVCDTYHVSLTYYV